MSCGSSLLDGGPAAKAVTRPRTSLQGRRRSFAAPLQVECNAAKAVEMALRTVAVVRVDVPREGCTTSTTCSSSDARARNASTVIEIKGSNQDCYQVLETLGQGSTGVVHRAARVADGLNVALKIVRKASEEFDPELLAIMKKEYQILTKIQHPYIIRAIDFFNTANASVLVMEFFDGPSLESFVRNSEAKRLKEDQARALFSQLLQAIDYLHQCRIVHRDVKADNVLVSQDGSCSRLVDFNTARCLAEGLSLTMTGTLDYAAPEVLKGESPSECGDIWSAGLCFYFMLAGRLPRRREQFATLADFADAVCSWKVALRGQRWQGISDPCKAILQDCLEVKMSLRPTAATILSRHDLWSSSGIARTLCHTALASFGTVGDLTLAHGFPAVSTCSDKCAGLLCSGNAGTACRPLKRARSLPSPNVRRGGSLAA